MHRIIPSIVIAATIAKLVGGQAIDPTTVDLETRQKWCDQQEAVCPLLCLQKPGVTGGTEQNHCEAETLIYECVCSNGQSPNASEYSQTIPYFECTESNNQCANNCGRNDACVTSCRTAHPCGAQDPTRVNTSTISTMAVTASASGGSAAETSGGSAVYTGFGSSSTAASNSDDPSAAQALAVGIGRTYGTAIVLSVVFGGFVML